MTTAIECRGLWKTYPGKPPVEAVRGLDLEVRAGECFGLLGPNGAGKTTTMEILEGLLDPSAGDVRVLGRTWDADAPALRQRLGVSLQETRLSDKLTVRETVRLFRSFNASGLDPDTVLEKVSLTEKAGTWVEKLSGGQRQRLAVACALVGDPELVFLDEPTTGLDPQSRRQLWDVVRAFRDQGRTVMLTTHYMDEAERLCDRVAVVDRGQVIALGSPAELIRQLGGSEVLEFEAEGTPPEPEAVRDLPGVQSVRRDGGTVVLAVDELRNTLPALLDRLRQLGVRMAGLRTRHASLEDVFVALTGRHLRDEGTS